MASVTRLIALVALAMVAAHHCDATDTGASSATTTPKDQPDPTTRKPELKTGIPRRIDQLRKQLKDSCEKIVKYGAMDETQLPGRDKIIDQASLDISNDLEELVDWDAMTDEWKGKSVINIQFHEMAELQTLYNCFESEHQDDLICQILEDIDPTGEQEDEALENALNAYDS